MSAPAPIPYPNITGWFSAELDKAVTALPDDGERYSFLTRQYNIWNQRRTRFFNTGGGSEAHSAHPQFGLLTATDFLLILGIIDQAKDRVVRAKVPA